MNWLMNKMKLSKYRNSSNVILKNLFLLFQKFYWLLQDIGRFLLNRNFRSILFLQLFKSKQVHQTTPYTYYNRYPDIFNECRLLTQNNKELNILSYGCSTGEEVMTLREYFPHANIIGAEINHASLKVCNNRNLDSKIKFIYSSRSEINKHGPYDIIFCMAVLQRKPHVVEAKKITNLKKIYPFEKFERQIIELDSFLKPGGIFVLHFSQYSFLDTKVAINYDIKGKGTRYKNYLIFDANSMLIQSPPPQHSIFIKRTKNNNLEMSV